MFNEHILNKCSDDAKLRFKVTYGEEGEELSFDQFRNICLLIESPEMNKAIQWVRNSYTVNGVIFK